MPIALLALSTLATATAVAADGPEDPVFVEAVLVEHCGLRRAEARLQPDEAPALFRGLGAMESAGQVRFSPIVATRLREPAKVAVGRRVPVDADGTRYHEDLTELRVVVEPERAEPAQAASETEAGDALRLDLRLRDGEGLASWKLVVEPGEVVVLPAFGSDRRCRGAAEGRSSLVVVVEQVPDADGFRALRQDRQRAREEGRAITGRRQVQALLDDDEATRMLADER